MTEPPADIASWAWKTLGEFPSIPMQSLVALGIVILLAIPLAVKAWKAIAPDHARDDERDSDRDADRDADRDRDRDRGRDRDRDRDRDRYRDAYELEPHIQQTPWLITTLTQISVQQQNTERAVEALAGSVTALRGDMGTLIKLARRQLAAKR